MPLARTALLAALTSLAGGCASPRALSSSDASTRGTPPALRSDARRSASTARAAASVEEERYSWQPQTRSPQGAAVEAEIARLLAACGEPDAALHRVAERIARRQARRLPQLDMPRIAHALRTEGSPHVWARAWSVEGKSLRDQETVERMEGWLKSFDDGGERRCGAASAVAQDQTRVVAVVALDALADLRPVPTRARSGQWIRVEAELLVPAGEAKVIVLGPRGAPRAITTSLHGRTVRASFAVDHPGAWLMQVLATVDSGPRPVVEAMIHADTEPPPTFRASPAPGEDAAQGAADGRQALTQMINQARAGEGLSRLRRDHRLDAVAQAHANAMLDAGRIGHDVGDGTPQARIHAAGIQVVVAGENVAHAVDLRRAHRALWSSPAHRDNLLHSRFDVVGIGIAEDEDGTVWVCQLLARF